jgi:hypothetical protein
LSSTIDSIALCFHSLNAFNNGRIVIEPNLFHNVLHQQRANPKCYLFEVTLVMSSGYFHSKVCSPSAAVDEITEDPELEISPTKDRQQEKEREKDVKDNHAPGYRFILLKFCFGIRHCAAALVRGSIKYVAEMATHLFEGITSELKASGAIW